VNTQHLETPNDLEAEAQQRAIEAARAPVESPAPVPELEQEIQSVLAKIEAPSARQRIRASLQGVFRPRSTQTAEANPQEQVSLDEVLSILREETRTRTKRRNRLIGIYLGILGLFITVAIVTHDKHMLNFLGSFNGLMAAGAAVSQRQKAASVRLALFDNVRVVGPLADALGYQDKWVQPIAAKKLTKLLPQMKASDAALLGPEQRAALNKALRGKNIELILAILKAWEQVGDTKAIEEVEKLAAGRGHGGRNPKVVAAAQECLPFLRQSAERLQVGSQLLRPSDGNLTPSDVLLRPSIPHAPTEPADQLLRPTNDTV